MSKTFVERPLARDAGDGFCLAICHDLRAPLATAGAALDALADEPLAAGDDAVRHHLAIARRSLCKADELLRMLPGLLARGTPVLHPTDLRSLLKVVRNDLDEEFDGAALRVANDLPLVLADSARLRIALRNLIHNAIRHRRADLGVEITIRGWRHTGAATITIADNGRGLHAGPSPRTGLGLGLQIARRAIEACGGSLTLRSRDGAGTTAAVTLATPRPQTRAAKTTPRDPGRSVRSRPTSTHPTYR